MTFLYTFVIFSFFLFLQSSTAQNRVNTSAGNPLIIGVPAISFSSKFVQKDLTVEITSERRYGGFSILVFEEALKLLDYKIQYKFVEYNGTYDDLVGSVGNKTLDAAVGDITIIAKRWDLVEFTVPYTESGLAMVVKVKRSEPWIFLKPFSLGLWLATGGILLYTMLVVWFFEHRSNPEFGGSWQHQLGNALWFTFTSLFTAHRETVKSNHSRVVVVVWLFLVLIVMQSFTASLSSLLTVKRLNPNVDLLRTKGAKVGCNPFIKRFVQNELGYKSENIELMRLEGEYLNAFKKGKISAALLEIPYAKLLVNGHCKDYAITGSSYRFGGLSFAFQKDSRLASDLSKAILTLSENGMLKRLESSWITSSSECLVDSNTQNTESLNFWSFWGLYLFSASITTASFLVFIVRLLRNYRNYQRNEINNLAKNNDTSAWKKIVRILKYLRDAELKSGAAELKSGVAELKSGATELKRGATMPSNRKVAPEKQMRLMHSSRF